MCAWSGGFKSCDQLLKRIEDNEPTLETVVILPMKTFGPEEVARLAKAIGSGKNCYLKHIYASGHKISTPDLALLSSAIATADCNVESLAIGDKTMGDVGVISFCEPFYKLKNNSIKKLDLSCKGLSEEGFSAIGTAFGQTNLKDLDLSRNNNCSRHEEKQAIVELCNAASANNNVHPFQHLTHLNLSDCKVEHDCVIALANMLFSSYNNAIQKDAEGNDTTLVSERLTLSLNNNPSIGRSPKCLSTLLMNFRLTSLSLTHCDIGDDAVHDLVGDTNNTSNIPSIQCLNLSHNRISEIGAKYISDSFLVCAAVSHSDKNIHYPCKLQQLILAGNPIGSAGVIAIASKLKQRVDILAIEQQEMQHFHGSCDGNDVIQEIDLSKTSCGIDGAIAILLCGGSLHSLRLFDNNLSEDDGFEKISKLLQGGHPNLKLLDLGGNRATDSSVCAILDSFLTEDSKIKMSLQVLELGGNQFAEKCEESLKRVKQKFPHLDIVRDRPLNNPNS